MRGVFSSRTNATSYDNAGSPALHMSLIVDFLHPWFIMNSLWIREDYEDLYLIFSGVKFSKSLFVCIRIYIEIKYMRIECIKINS